MVGIGVTKIHIFLKLQMWKFVKSKIALILVQFWVCKNEVLDFKNTKISRNHDIKRTSISNPFQQVLLKKGKILLVIEFRRYSKFSFSKFIKKIADSIGESNHT